jgi:hypothetical protein
MMVCADARVISVISVPLRQRMSGLSAPTAVSATISEAVAEAFKNTEALGIEGLRIADGVTVSDIAGAGFEPATFGL